MVGFPGGRRCWRSAMSLRGRKCHERSRRTSVAAELLAGGDDSRPGIPGRRGGPRQSDPLVEHRAVGGVEITRRPSSCGVRSGGGTIRSDSRWLRACAHVQPKHSSPRAFQPITMPSVSITTTGRAQCRERSEDQVKEPRGQIHSASLTIFRALPAASQTQVRWRNGGPDQPVEDARLVEQVAAVGDDLRARPRARPCAGPRRSPAACSNRSGPGRSPPGMPWSLAASRSSAPSSIQPLLIM